MMSRASIQMMAMVTRAFLSVSFCRKGWTMQRNLWEGRHWWLWAPGGMSLRKEGSQNPGVEGEDKEGFSLHMAFGDRDRLGSLQIGCFQLKVGKDTVLGFSVGNFVILLEIWDTLLMSPGDFP